MLIEFALTVGSDRDMVFDQFYHQRIILDKHVITFPSVVYALRRRRARLVRLGVEPL